MNGGGGNDTLRGGAGTDILIGGQGNDVYILDDMGDQIIEYANQGTDAVLVGTDYTLLDNFEYLIGTGQSGQRLTGNALDNYIQGNGGDDIIIGRGGNDLLFGNYGADRFVFGNGDLGSTEDATDAILDFYRVEGDRIDLSGIDARTDMAGDQAFTFIGTNAFTGVAGQMRYSATAYGSLLQMDTNGDGNADLVLRLEDVNFLQSSDFIF